MIVASQYGLKKPYTDYTPADFQASIDTLVRTIARADGSRVTTIGRGKLGPLDAYTYALEGPGGSTSRIMIGFKDRTEYYVDCTSQPVQAKTISSACDQVTKTFAVH